MPEMVESTVEEATLDWLSEFHYSPLYGLDIAPGEPASERESFADVVLVARLRDAVEGINPQLPPVTVDEVARKVLRTETPSLIENNHRFHHMLVNGMDVQYRSEDGRTVHVKASTVLAAAHDYVIAAAGQSPECGSCPTAALAGA